MHQTGWTQAEGGGYGLDPVSPKRGSEGGGYGAAFPATSTHIEFDRSVSNGPRNMSAMH